MWSSNYNNLHKYTWWDYYEILLSRPYTQLSVSIMSQGQSSLPQNKEAQLRSYQVHLKDNVRSMFDNFTEIIRLARVSDKV